MAPPKARLESLRAEIDRLDATLVLALMRRSRVVLRIADLKSKHGLGGVDLPRERAILERVERTRSKGRRDEPRGYSREALEHIFRTILDESRRLLDLPSQR